MTLNWIHTRLEYILGTAFGLTAFAVDVPLVIMKLVLAVMLGFLGAAGATLWKILVNYLKNKLKNDKSPRVDQDSID